MSGWRLAPDVQRLSHSRLAGGAPYRIVRLAPEGRAALATLLGTTDPAPPGSPSAALADRLVRAGILLAPSRGSVTAEDITVVIPVLGRTEQVRTLLARVPDRLPVVVVDDGSQPRIDPTICDRPQTRLIRHPTSLGPGAARNAGAAVTTTEWVAFIDADVDPGEDWLGALLAHADSDVVAIAPRIVSAPVTGAVGLVEQWCGALDRGPTPQDVGPGRAVSFVPTAVLLVRRESFHAAGGFVADLTVGEDVDLVWRLLDIGRVRYEPDVVALHQPRPSLWSVLRRRYDYGTSAAALERHHPGAIRHADVSVWSLAPWLLAALIRPRVGLAAAVATVAIAPRGLQHLPPTEAMTLAVRGHLLATVGLGRYLARPLWPVTVLAVAMYRRPRSVLVGSLALGYADVARRRLAADGLGRGATTALTMAAGRSVSAAVLDDAAYGLGVWTSCWQARQIGPLLPRVRDLPRPASLLRRGHR